jgi:hypothetical protein
VFTLRERAKQLDGALESSRRPALSLDELHGLLEHHRELLERAAAKLHGQHERVDGHRRAIKAALRRDPFTERREREAATRDKYKPADVPLALENQMPPPSAAAAPGAVPGAPGAPALGGLGTPALGLGTPAAANPFGGLGLATTPGAANPFGAPKPAATMTLGAPATPAAGGGLFGGAATTPAASPFGAPLTLGAPAAAPAAGGLFGAATPGATLGGGLFGAAATAGTQQRPQTAKKKQTSKR